MERHDSLEEALGSRGQGVPWVLVSDVDGVLTDGKFYYASEGKILKQFGSHDADALKNQDFFSKLIFVSADIRGSNITRKRLEDMGQALDLADSRRRVEIIDSFQKSGFRVCFVGDSFSDIPALNAADLGVTPAGSFKPATQAADLVLECRGGEGALAELFLRLRGTWK